MNYTRLNNLIGWLTFLMASIVYVLTMEPTTSFWDCGEFIATAYKLQVGHPPGAPLFLMLGRLFSMFADPENVAYYVNLMSALSSAATNMFLFWSITLLARKIVAPKEDNPTLNASLGIFGAGLVGALANTFSDTFWFSAVEAEVYGMSSLFTAVVFWAILKWERVADEPKSNRWLVFIAYTMGLSIGVHLLNLLAIPALTFVYYLKKFKPSVKGIAITSVVAVAILGFVQKGIIPGTISLAAKFELLFVNGLGAPFNTGTIIYLFLLFGGLVYGLYYTFQKNKPLIHTALLCVLVILIGYSSYGMIVVRSLADTPMDENNPENVFTLLSYLNREQYGSQPLAYGQYFNSPLDNKLPYKDGDPVYYQDKKSGKYIISDSRENSIPNYAPEFMTVFPRMYSSESRHIRSYKFWSNYEGRPIRYRNMQGEMETIRKPTMGENLTFFMGYQINWMYVRYFLWNFAGRQNDVQGHDNTILDGNWLSGIPFIDNARLGDQSAISDEMRENKARNKFYFLPLILGLLGLYFHYKKQRKDFAIVTLLFFFTGLAIILYLNQYPFQPRERDYAYAGSFYAFTIWIGLGVLYIQELIQKLMKSSQVSAIAATTICLILVPGIMAKDGWDDHDRSNRYTARDIARAYLDSCDPNAILFTNGDNDTFPLWYVQEVEGYRTDVRVINLSLFNTDWYIDQMSKKAYDSDPAPFSIVEEQYRQGTRDYLPVINKNKNDVYLDVNKVIKFVTDEASMAQFSSNKRMNYMPTNKFSLKVNKERVLADGSVPESKINEIVDEIQWSVSKNYIMKKDMMMLDLLAQNDWERPVYYAITTGNDAYLGLQNYFQIEGLAYRLVPFTSRNSDGQIGYVNTEKMFDNMINKFQYGGMENPGIYMDENNRRMTMNLRNNFARLAEALLKEGKNEKAKEALDFCMKMMPKETIPYNFFMVPIAEAYYKLGENEKAENILGQIATTSVQEMNFYFGLKENFYKSVNSDAQQSLSILYRINSTIQQFAPDSELATRVKSDFDEYNSIFMSKQS